MCKCRRARGFTICAVCLGLLSAPVGAINPPAAVVGHILNAGSPVATALALKVSTPNTVTGAVHRLPPEVRAAIYEHDPPVESGLLTPLPWRLYRI